MHVIMVLQLRFQAFTVCYVWSDAVSWICFGQVEK